MDKHDDTDEEGFSAAEATELITTIRQQRQAFAYGIESIHTLFNTGATDRMKPLRTAHIDELVNSSWLLPQRAKMNTALQQAASNGLAMQLLVAVHGAIDEYDVGHQWMDDDETHPTFLFLRRVRNAVAHGNKVDDRLINTSGEWRGFSFVDEMRGMRVFTQPEAFDFDLSTIETEAGVLEVGDALVLVDDVLYELATEAGVVEPDQIIWVIDR
jgi:hypothetical protein